MVAGALATIKKPSLAGVITETVDPEISSVMASHGFICVTYRPFERSVFAADGSGRAEPLHNTLFVRTEPLGERLKSAAKRRVAGTMV